MPYIDHLSWSLIYEQNKYVTSLMNNQPIFHPVNIKFHQLKLKRACMVMSCFRIFQEDEISISTATFMNMKNRSLMSMPSLIGQPPIINIYWVPAMYQAVIMELSQAISLILEVDIIIAILKVMKLEFTEIKWFVQNDTLNKNSSSEFKFKYLFCCILCTVFRRNTDLPPNGSETGDLTVVLHSKLRTLLFSQWVLSPTEYLSERDLYFWLSQMN